MPHCKRYFRVAKPSRRYFLGALGASGISAGVPSIQGSAAADTYTLRLSLSEAGTSILGRTALHFAASVESRAKGQLKIEVYPLGQLAQQQESIGALATGVIDFALTTTAYLEPLLPQFQVFAAPFLFKDPAVAFQVLNGPIGAELFAQLEPKGIIGLGWGIGGFKQLQTVSKPIVVPDDMKGLRIRSVVGAVYAATYQSLGAIPVTIDLSEVFTALQQHTIDGMDLLVNAFTSGKYYTVCKHVAMLNHLVNAEPLLGSKRKIEALPPSLQRVLKESGREAMSTWRAAANTQLAADIGLLKTNGVGFSEIQYPAFRKAVEPVYALLQSRLGGDLLDRIRRAANA